LEELVSERTAQLETANKELDAFSYSASHDLRAPLQTIDGFSRALQEDYGDSLDAGARDYLQRIRAATKHMGQLTDALLQFSRLARSGMVLENVDLGAMVRAAADQLHAQDPAREVVFDIAADTTAYADRRLLGAVLENLLGNAWKFTSRHPRASIEFGVAEREAERVYYVRDDGAGFDMDRAQKLFTPFQRLHTTSDFPGNGVGLALVKRIIQRHGGRIWAEAAPEKGATFYFTLPGAPAKAPISV
jgi:light-regulated signal transduction histidine kinase (bacteriophytochrome)